MKTTVTLISLLLLPVFALANTNTPRPATGEGGTAQRGVREIRLAQGETSPQGSDTSRGQVREFNIDAPKLSRALIQLTEQSGLQLIYPAGDKVTELPAKPLTGKYTTEAALKQLLKGTGLSYEFLDAKTISIVDPSAKSLVKTSLRGTDGTPNTGTLRLAQNTGNTGEENTGTEGTRNNSAKGTNEKETGEASAEDSNRNSSAPLQEVATPEILVKGSRSLNTDIQRTEDDPQPYLVFDARELERSGAANLEEFFRTRLPMNAQKNIGAGFTGSIGPGGTTNVSQINLRGIGITQTLILVDGRRAPRIAGVGTSNGLDTGTEFRQADINGIALAALERIEVLPATAGGIYGGGAVGGVINIIRKRNYRGIDARIGFDSPSRGGGEAFRSDLSGGFSPDHGLTQIGFSATYAKTNSLGSKDNGLTLQGRRLLNANFDESRSIAIWSSTTPNILSNTLNPACGCRSNLVLDNGTVLSSNRLAIPAGYPGLLLGGIAPLLGTLGEYNLALAEGNSFNGTLSPLRVGSKVKSVNSNVRREITQWLDLFADAGYSENRATHNFGYLFPITVPGSTPNNPFRQAIQVGISLPSLEHPAISKSETLNAAAGLIAKLGSDWAATLQYDWSKSRNRTDFVSSPLSAAGIAALQNGTLDVLRDTTRFPLDLSPYRLDDPDSLSYVASTQATMSARLGGTLFALPGGDLSATLLAERRIERAPNARTQLTSISGFGTSISDSMFPARQQSINSAYAELRAPLFSERNAIALIRELELQASVRHDEYTTRVPVPSSYPPDTPPATIDYDSSKLRSTDFTLALRWAPVRDLTLRASYGTGFLPPSLSQVGASQEFNALLSSILDPLRGNEQIGLAAPAVFILGANSDLRPEQSTSLSVGGILTPRFLPGLRLSADYSRIRKSGEIGAIPRATLLANESAFPGRVVRQPGANDPVTGFPPPIILIDQRLANIAKTEIKAWDFQADYEFQTKSGADFHLYTVATRQTSLLKQVLPTLAPFESVDFNEGPLKWRGNAGLDWTYKAITIAWNTQYFDSYSVRNADPAAAASSNAAVLRQGAERIPSQIYSDIGVTYRVGNESGALKDVRLQAGIQNIFDKKPPVTATVSGGYSSYGDPRLRRFSISLTKSFGAAR